MRAVIALCAASLALTGCATLNHWDLVFGSNAEMTQGTPVEQMGLVFGSIGIPRDDVNVFSGWIVLSSGPPRHEKIEITAARWLYTSKRPADVENDKEAIWTFSGRLPAGQYVIEGAGVLLPGKPYDREPRVPRRIPFEPAIQVTVTAGGSVYLGRWTARVSALDEGLATRSRPGDMLIWDDPIFSVGLRDAFEEDGAILERHRAERWVPALRGPIVNPFDGLKAPRATGGNAI